MRPALPDWLPTQATPGSVETAVARARQSLRLGDDVVYLTGSSALDVAGAVVARTAGTVICARLAGSTSIADALLLMAWGMDLLHPGDPHAVPRTLETMDAPLILVDARGLAEGLADEIREHLAPSALAARWMLVVDTGTAPTNAIGAGVGERSPSALLATQLPIQAHALGWLLAGIPGANEAAFISRVPGIKRQAIWPTVARNLQAQSPYAAAEVADALGPELERHQQIALGGPQPAITVPADFFALRWIGRHASDEVHATMAAAAAARLALGWGMVEEAGSLLNEAWLRTSSTKGSCRALIRWAQARVALDTGDRYTAQLRFEEATSTLRQERNLSLLAVATRRWAERLAARGETKEAAGLLRNARILYRQLDDAGGVGATLRGAGDVAIASGENLSAEALFDQAGVAAITPIEQVNLQLSQAALAIARGEHQRAQALLSSATKGAAGVPLLEANALRRDADMALREGDHERAKEATKSARKAYARLGEHIAEARCIRLLGDIVAAQGQLEAAAQWYERAIKAQIRVDDQRGLSRTLSHAATLEEVSGDPVLARELNRMASRLQSHTATP